MAKPDLTTVKPLLESARSVSILLPQSPHYDEVASALSLKLSLESAGKTVSVACPDPMTVEFNRLVGVDSISTSFGSRNLVISFHDMTDQVDKVTYNLDSGELRLVITPKDQAPDLDHRRLRFIPGTTATDAIIFIGLDTLQDLGALHSDAQNLISGNSHRLISLTRLIPRENYAAHQVYDHEAGSLSEVTLHLLDSLSLSLSPDIATNLLYGLEAATDGFRASHVSVSTFETAAHLMKRGARRQSQSSPAQYPQGSIPTQPYTQTQIPAPQPSAALGYGTDSAPQAEDSVPADWYSPKVYQGPKLV